MSSQEELRNEESAHRFHMDIFQRGDIVRRIMYI
jgi:hypothetical protein